MKKILGVVGSPRRNGNTHILVSKLLESAAEAGAETDILFLADLDIHECNGCHVCREGGDCSKHDDMNDIYPKIIGSDIIVFGTPVYWYGPTALMKAFIDRFVYFNTPANRALIRGKSAVIAVPFEEDNPETAAPLLAMFEKSFSYLEMNFDGRLIVPGTGHKGDVLKKSPVLKEAEKLGKHLAYGV